MLFQVKRLPSISSADQYLVSSPQTTEVSPTAGYPLLLKYHNIGDTAGNSCFDTPCYLFEHTPPDGTSECPVEGSKFYIDYPEDSQLSSLPDFNALNDVEEMPYSSNSSQQGLLGLYNLENSCFLNSIVQCLRFTKPLFVYIFKDEYLDDLNGDNPELVEEFSRLVKNLWSYSPNARSISPLNFAKAMHRFSREFDGYTQQDAHEFLLCVLSGLHENLNVATSRKPVKISSTDAMQSHTMWQNYLSSDNSRIIDIFVGQLRSTLTCTHCNTMSSTFDPCWDLSLPIPSSSNGPTTIQQCLRACLNDELIDGANMPFCNRCKSHKPSEKQLAIHKLPKVLILHLKRFTDDQVKLNNMVEFPVKNLDIGPFCSGGVRSGVAKYNLYAVVNHTGSMTYGHYTAFCHNPIINEWFEFNDHQVIPLESADRVVTDKAYILFYELWGQSSKL